MVSKTAVVAQPCSSRPEYKTPECDSCLQDRTYSEFLLQPSCSGGRCTQLPECRAGSTAQYICPARCCSWVDLEELIEVHKPKRCWRQRF